MNGLFIITLLTEYRILDSLISLSSHAHPVQHQLFLAFHFSVFLSIQFIFISSLPLI